MSKDIEKTENENLPAQSSQHNAYEAFGAQATQRNIVGSILKFTKGFWKAGMNNDDIEDDVQLIVEMRSLMVGWQKWVDDKPVDNHMGLVSENFQPPSRRVIGDNKEDGGWEEDDNGVERDPWQKSNMVIMRAIGTLTDTEGLYTFVTSSRGGLNAIGELSKRYGRKIREDDTLLPIIELDKDSYLHSNKRIGEVYIPVLKLVGWGRADDVVENAASVEVVEMIKEAEEVKPKKAIPAQGCCSESGAQEGRAGSQDQEADQVLIGRKKPVGNGATYGFFRALKLRILLKGRVAK
jgi:hypothetical protein